MSVRTRIETKDAPRPIGPYSQAIVASGFVFVSGQIPLDPETQATVEGDIERQTERTLRNVEAVLRAAGSDLDSVVRCVVYLKDVADFAAMNRVYDRFFGDEKPSRSTVAVAALPRDVRIEIEATALLRQSRQN